MTKKKMTKLLDAKYRASILNSISKNKLLQYKIPAYSRYTVDT